MEEATLEHNNKRNIRKKKENTDDKLHQRNMKTKTTNKTEPKYKQVIKKTYISIFLTLTNQLTVKMKGTLKQRHKATFIKLCSF